ncbi:MAG: LamG domain-containing protein [Planctomycetes bacterium]|nr:LamG domain-containing protein [Planctomycetota bacterium]
MGKRAVCLVCCLAVLGTAGVTFGELVGHWKLDEGTGTKIGDSSGKGNNGTVTAGNPTWIAGIKDGALEFHGLGVSGGGGDTITIPHSASLDITGPISMALWIKPGADDPEGKATTTAPMAKALSTASPSWSFQVRYGWGGAPQPYMAFTFNTTPRAWAFVGKKLTRDEWCNIACSYDGTTLKCYLNGLQTDSTPMGPITSSPTPVLIGSDGWGCDWIGDIDDVQMYNNALTADQIAEICPPSRAAKNPNPADGAVGVSMPLFRWDAGYKGVMHEVYLGTSPDLAAADLAGPRSGMTMFYYTKPLTPGATYYWRVDEIEADGTTVNTGDVWSFTMQALTAYLPSPADGATDASVAAGLAWQPGQAVVKHHVYFGTAADAVTQGAASTDKGIQEGTSFTPGPLDSVTTYYWRVDEIKADNSVVAGAVWSFTTCLPVDDFESYNDDLDAKTTIFDTWIDGLTTGQSGSIVGNSTAPFAEQTIVHGGKQSMPIDYNNVKAPFYSEAEREFAPAENWTTDGVDTLVLDIQGRPNNNATGLYVVLTDSSNKSAVVTYPEPAPIRLARWTEWKIPLADFTGVNAAKIKKIAIGLGSRTATGASGTGRIYVDDIRVIKDKK